MALPMMFSELGHCRRNSVVLKPLGSISLMLICSLRLPRCETYRAGVLSCDLGNKLVTPNDGSTSTPAKVSIGYTKTRFF
jgi:hypothetical protein